MSFVENKISKPSLSIEKYFEEYKLSIDDPEKFWSDKHHHFPGLRISRL